MKTVAIFAIVALGVASGSPIPNVDFPCPTVCAQVYQPVCGTNGVQLMTFGNECKMLQHTCANFKKEGELAIFNLLRSGECDEGVNSLGGKGFIPGALSGIPRCSEEWKPVCGSDGKVTKTFPNECIMNVFNALDNTVFLSLRSGPCDEKDVPKPKTAADCPPCLAIFAPVCASDGVEVKTFGNQCEVDAFNCYESRSFATTRSGECW